MKRRAPILKKPRLCREIENNRSMRLTKSATLVFTALVALLTTCSREPETTEPSTLAAPKKVVSLEEELLPSIPGAEPITLSKNLEPLAQKLDPSKDQGWNSEVFHVAAGQQLSLLAKMIENGDGAWSDVLESAFTSSFLRPESLDDVHEDGLLRVARGDTGERTNTDMKRLVSALVRPMGMPSNRHVKFKVFGVEMAQEGIETRAYYNASAETGNGVVQQDATWHCVWANSTPPMIASIKVTSFEEVTPVVAGGLRFEDATHTVMGNEQSFREQLSIGADHWRNRLQIDFGTDVNGLQGLAIGDANGDGLDDLYVCQPGALPNRLYLRQTDGTLKDASAAAGVDWMELTRSALFVDLDNDGDQDLVLAQDSYYMLLENDGSARFTKRLEKRTEAKLRSASAVDVDNDGNLDLYFCGRNPGDDEDPDQSVLGFPLPYHDANNGGPNVLLANEGTWQFQDKTKALGLDVNNRRFSFACAWEDYDNDGDQDLYVANDFGRNNLYRNDLDVSGRFIDVAPQLGVEDMSAGMSITWGDANRDGRMDVYVSNMFSSAGNRIAYQREFRQGRTDQLASFQRHARGNTLFINQGDRFEDVSGSAAVTMGRWAWGSLFADLNNDGWEDLYVANGFITTEDTGDL